VAWYNGFIKALLLNDIEAMNEFVGTIALTPFSCFDIAESVAENDAPERGREAANPPLWLCL
jgi:hypothetical protein